MFNVQAIGLVNSDLPEENPPPMPGGDPGMGGMM